ncbi:TPA: hypothetical protein EYP66_11420 [Candidatus Poribacteria bacterium]|nr:hypothetical protein [Candidatus Poribacteria bacterium]
MRVKTWTAEEIEVVYLVREALEGIACRLFAERASEMDRMALAIHLWNGAWSSRCLGGHC